MDSSILIRAPIDEFIKESSGAYLVKIKHFDKPEWFPKSLCTAYEDYVVMPLWIYWKKRDDLEE